MSLKGRRQLAALVAVLLMGGSPLVNALEANAVQKDLVLNEGSGLSSAMVEGLNQKMVLDLRDMDIIDALKFLAVKGGINIIAAQGVGGRVSLFLQDVTIGDALQIILMAN